MGNKVFVGGNIPEVGIEKLSREVEVVVNKEDKDLSKEELISRLEGVQGFVSLLSHPIDREVIENVPDLKVISNYAVGYNNIDLKAATERGIIVTNTPDVLTEATADLTWALLMSAARRIVESDKFVREGKFEGWRPRLFLGQEIWGKTLGVIGLGRIGSAVAKRGHGFGMKVLYNKRNRLSPEEEKKLGVEYRDVQDLFREADFIAINAPLNDSTYHLISSEEFKMMKDTAILINAGRGPIIDEDALVNALTKGEIAGAGLDVYEDEPEVHPGLMELDNVVLTPHTGSATEETRNKMAEMVAEDVLAVLNGRRAINVVNPEVYKK